MPLRNFAAALSAAAILALGCDTTHFDSPDPEVVPARQETQPAVSDQHYISPDDALPRPESPRQPEYPVTPSAQTPATDQTQPQPAEPAPSPSLGPNTGVIEGDTQQPASAAQESSVVDEPAVREVPADPVSTDQN